MEEQTINFINPDTNKEISIKLDKPLIIIYGKNGSGKTTFSRSADFNKKYVFNTDFIYQNVYVETFSGTKDDKDTKNSFSKLWLGQNVIVKQKELEIIREKTKKYNEELDSKRKEICAAFNEKEIQLDINQYEKQIIYNDIDFDIVENDYLNDYRTTLNINTNINSDDILNIEINKSKNNIAISMLIDDLKRNELLKDLFIDKRTVEREDLLNKIHNYNESINELKEIEKAFLCKNAEEEYQWIKKALSLHKNIDTCLFCGNTDIKDKIKYWNNIVESESKKIKNNLLEIISINKKAINDICLKEDKYILLAPNIIRSIKRIYDFLVNIELNIQKNIIIANEFIFPNIDFDELIQEVNDINQNISNYIIKPFWNKYEAIKTLALGFQKLELKKDDEICDEMKKNASSISTKINAYLIRLGLDKELSVKIDRKGNDKKYSFDFQNKNTKLSTLSDGQKHKLALSIFLANLDDNEDINETIVLDDPVVSLDERTYHAIKNEIKLLTSKFKRVVILTHNIGYLYIQLSNLFNTPFLENISLYQLMSSTIKEINPKIINYDDLTLYKNGIDELQNHDEFSCLAYLNLRIYRYFIDFKLRMKGIPDTGNPRQEIKLLDLNDVKKEQSIEVINSKIVRIIKDTKSKNKELFESFNLINELMKELDFPDLLSSDEIDKLSTYANDDIRSNNYNNDNLLFSIINWARCINESTDAVLKDIKDYMNHPRHQLTKTIVSLNLSDLEE